MQRMIEVESERFYSAHHGLLRMARASLRNAQKKDDAWRDAEFLTIALSALAIEALCNAVGERAVKGWEDFENSSPTAKMRVICTTLGIDYNGSREPWGNLRWLSRFRNLVAHPKAEKVTELKLIPEDEHDDTRPHPPPESKLEKLVTLANAEKAVASVEATLNLFCKKLKPEDAFGLHSDSWLTSTRIAPLPVAPSEVGGSAPADSL